MSRPIIATIDLSALRHNLSVARRHAPRSSVLAVVKANAYGHGIARAARSLVQAGVEGFALLELDAAIALREAGYTQRIVLLEGFLRPKSWRCWRNIVSTPRYTTQNKLPCCVRRRQEQNSMCC